MTRIPTMMLLIVAAAFCLSSQLSAQEQLEGIWYFRVDRAWDGKPWPGFPSSMLAESTYHHVSKGPTYRIVISGSPAEGYQISIGDPPIKGQLQPAAIRAFDLHDGTFAGGRFVIMPGKDGLEGELTIYGSGVPIIKSERGTLTR